MKFKYKPGKESYFDYLKKIMWVKKKKNTKNKDDVDTTTVTLEELNK